MLHAPIIIIEINKEKDRFNIIEYNEGFSSLIGEKKHKISLEGLPEAIEKEISNAVKSGVSYYFDPLNIRYFRITCTHITDQKCSVLFTEERHKVITGVPKGELEFLRMITENSNDGFWLMDNKLNTLFMSPSIKNQMGYTVEEYISIPITQRLPEESLPIMQHNLQKLIQDFQKDPSKSNILFEIPHKHKDGHHIWGEVNLKILHDSDYQILGFIGITRNVNERHQLLKKIEESEKLFRQLTENSPSSIFIYQDEKLVYANPATQKLTGFSDKELLQMNFWDIVSPEHIEIVKLRGLQRQKGADIINNYEFCIITKNGEKKWIDYTGALITFNGKPAGIGNIVDITQIKETEFALRKNEEKLLDLFEMAVDGIITGDIEGKITGFNTRAEEITGIQRKQILGKHLTNLFSAKVMKENPLRFDLLDEGKMLVNQRSLTKPTGEVVVIEMNSRRMPDKSYHAFIRDITNRIKTEKDLETNREKFYTVFEKTQSPIFIIDENGNYIDANNAGLAFMETDKKGLLKMNVTSTIQEKTSAKLILDKHTKLWKSGGTIETNYSINGKIKTLLLTITPTLIDQKKQIYGIGTDITEQNRYLKALSESEEKFRHMSDNIADGITIIDNHKIIYTNQRLSEITGHSPEELIHIKGIDLAAPWEKSRIKKIMSDAQTSKKIISELEFSIISKSGEEKYLYNRYSGSATNPSRSYIITTDITDRKKIEKELIQKNAEYKKLNLELSNAITKAQESDKLKSAFMANMSHEIRTPLNAIMGFSEMLKKKNLPFEKVESYASVINQGGSHLLNLINDIIDVSKIEAGQMTLFLGEVNVNSLFKETFHFFDHTARKKGLEFHLEIPEKTTKISGDETKLKQILNNLISNAIKFTEYGEVRFGYTIEESSLVIFVKDTGIGIKKEEIPLIFERFRQLETNQSNNFPGTGLGLSIVNGLVSLMQGEIKVSSTLFRGSVFEITIPFEAMDKKRREESENSTYDHESDLSKYTLLVAEDESLSRLLVHEILQPTGIQIIDAKDGEEAIEFAIKQKVHLVLMDMGLPKIDGYLASQEIRKIMPLVPIIGCSAYAFGSDKDKAIKSGCNEFITKPYQMEQLIGLISNYLKNNGE
ncbi:MAG: hypothetical protein CVU05_09615 [Bacteroidetes bacterium HGW-Bacteroidetes-21]|jgi:hypothetical protein|nr:MAG: hypothetical protein CVU05_09615 [Bacteroidetes bacterium HGW-Bacteroidetes-21]